ncbi:PD-(D/E)XK nuclease family protein [Candidatus Pacearchaeota archaeon]|nr:PD-(D/E)XK nuclease family protein [Candidatus Pacearchaeota archaeon]
MPYKLSPSALSLMGECPRCFWLHHNKNKKRPSGIFPSLPSGMDGILKTHFDKFRDKGKLPPELKENKDCKGCKLFEDKELLVVWRNNFKGISLKDKEGNVLHGAVDNLLVKGKKIIVLDYKTRGFPCKDDTADHYQNQLDIYNYLLRKNGYETEDYSFLLFYVPKEVTETGEVVFDTTLKKMKIDVKNAEQIWKKALKLLSGPCPKDSQKEEECEWCKLIQSEDGE